MELPRQTSGNLPPSWAAPGAWWLCTGPPTGSHDKVAMTLWHFPVPFFFKFYLNSGAEGLIWRYLCPFYNCCLSCFFDRQILIKQKKKLQKHNGSRCFSCGVSHPKKPHPVPCRYVFRNCLHEVPLAVSPEMLVRLTPSPCPLFFF